MADELTGQCADVSGCAGYMLSSGACISEAECVGDQDRYLVEGPVKRCVT